LSRIHFSSHALERAEQRLFPGLSPNRCERLLQEAWNRGPAKLKSSKDEERWLIQDPEAVLVCAIEKGRRVVKTILFRLRNDPDVFEASEDFEPVRRIVVSVAVEYERRALASHVDVEEKLRRIVTNAVRGVANCKEFKILNQETTLKVELLLSQTEAGDKAGG